MRLILPFTSLNTRSRERLAYSVAALAGAATLGTVGYILIEGWTLSDSLFMTVMTVTTVGYGSPQPLTPWGQRFTTFFMIVGVGTTGYALSNAIQVLVQSEILSTLGARRRHREMNKLQDHYIICGVGRIGMRIIREMQRADVPFVAIESNQQKIANLVGRGTLVIVGDATLDETLREAGVERARGLAACLPDDADNVYVVLSARNLNRELYIVARAVEEQAEPKLIRAGADRIVAPTIIGSHRMAQSLLKPAVADFIDSVTAENLDLAFEQVEVRGESVYSNQKLSATNIRSELNIVIVAIRRHGGEMIFNPPGDALIKAGDLLIAIGRAETLALLKRTARGEK